MAPDEARLVSEDGTVLVEIVFEIPVTVDPVTAAFPDFVTVPPVPTPALPLIFAFPDKLIAPMVPEFVCAVPLLKRFEPP